MIKKIILGVLLVSCIFIIFSTKSEAAVSLEQTNVDIYQLNGYTAYKYGLELPSNLPTTYQIKVNGSSEKPKYEVIEGTDIVNVDENGLVQAKVTRVTYQEGNNVIGTFNRYNFGTATIKVTVSNKSLEIKMESEINNEKAKLKELDFLEEKLKEKDAIIEDKQDQVKYLRELINDYRLQIKEVTENLEVQLRKVSKTYEDLLNQKDMIIEKQDENIASLIKSTEEMNKTNKTSMYSLEAQNKKYQKLIDKLEEKL